MEDYSFDLNDDNGLFKIELDKEYVFINFIRNEGFDDWVSIPHKIFKEIIKEYKEWKNET